MSQIQIFVLEKVAQYSLEVYNYHSAWNQYKDSKNYIPTWMKEIRSHLVEQQNNN